MPLKPRGPVAVLVAACALAAPATAAADARDVARDYLDANPDKFGVTSADFADVFVMSVYKTSGTGVTHVNVNQRYQGLEVFGGHATVNVGPDGSVIFAGGTARAARRRRRPRRRRIEAAAGRGVGGARAQARRRRRSCACCAATATKSRKTVLSGGGISDAPIEAKLGWQPTARRPAARVAERDRRHVGRAPVEHGGRRQHRRAAEQRRLDVARQRRRARAAARAPGRRGAADAGVPAPFASLISPPNPVLDGSAYRVFAWPNESPNDAGRTLVANPADSVASPYGWHDIDDAAGADFTTTQGNNVHAYMDQDSNNAPDYRSSPSGGSSLRFDFPIDLTQHAQAYRDVGGREPVLRQQHDPRRPLPLRVRRRLGQLPGRTTTAAAARGGDAVRAEAADGNGTNNANFSTPAADGGAPRMQMYLWPGNQLGAPEPARDRGGATYGASWARFAPPVPHAGLPGRTLVYGGTGCSESDLPGLAAGLELDRGRRRRHHRLHVPAARRDRAVAERRRGGRRRQRGPATRRRS